MIYKPLAAEMATILTFAAKAIDCKWAFSFSQTKQMSS